MAALAVPVLEGAALALLRALGVATAAGAGAVAVNEAAKKKANEAEKAKDAPIAKAGTQSKTRDSCKKCPPDCGALVERNWAMSEDSRAYQARISGFAPYTEWNFEGTDFDGFESAQCLLLEAKARYDQFFKPDGTPRFFFTLVGERKIRLQARRQSDVVMSSLPAQLHWHFMQPLSFRYFTREFRQRRLAIVPFLTP